MDQEGAQDGPRPCARDGWRMDIGGAPVVDAFPEAHVDDRDAASLRLSCHTGDRDARRGAMLSEEARWNVLS